MKFNWKELIEYSSGEAVIEGRLHHKKITGGFSQSGFKEKWFKLRANVLFYFNSSETAKTYDRKPAGAFILENTIVEYEMISEAPFSFSITFHDDLEKKHLFAGRSEEYINQWVKFLKEASYEFWRSQLMTLQMKLCKMTGKDPLLMYPRNEGSTSTCVDDPCAHLSPKTRKASPTFRSYVAGGEQQDKKVHRGKGNEGRANFFVDDPFDMIGHQVESMQINLPPPPEPPKRPARGNKIKAETAPSPNLIEF